MQGQAEAALAAATRADQLEREITQQQQRLVAEFQVDQQVRPLALTLGTLGWVGFDDKDQILIMEYTSLIRASQRQMCCLC